MFWKRKTTQPFDGYESGAVVFLKSDLQTPMTIAYVCDMLCTCQWRTKEGCAGAEDYYKSSLILARWDNDTQKWALPLGGNDAVV